MRAIRPAPDDVRVRIGARLRASRQSQGMTIDQIAEATGLTKGFISRVERDETSPSVASLLTICQVLSLPVGTLFETPSTDVVVLSDAPLINMGGSGVTERLLTPRTESSIQVLHSTLDPGADGGAELYTINCHVEVVHVIEGQLLLRFLDRDAELSAGDTVTFAGREPHTWHNAATGTTRLLWILIPAPWSGSS